MDLDDMNPETAILGAATSRVIYSETKAHSNSQLDHIESSKTSVPWFRAYRDPIIIPCLGWKFQFKAIEASRCLIID